MRLYRKAVELDPNYAIAWALLSITQSFASFFQSDIEEDPLPAAERALELDPNLSEAHVAKSRILTQESRYEEALVEAELAIRLDPNSYDANAQIAQVLNALRRYAEEAPYYERADELNEMDFSCIGMALCCYEALGDPTAIQSAARRSLDRLEKVVADEPDNGSAISFGVNALSALGDIERAKEWTERALLFDPDNKNMQYNIACSFSKAGDADTALDILEPLFENLSSDAFAWAKTDSDLDPIRNHPRYKAMMAKAEARLASQKSSDDSVDSA